MYKRQPEWFRDKCTGLAAFVAAVNAELRASAGRRQFRAKMEESRSAAWSQYEDFAEILIDVARELGSLNGADPLAERRLMRYLRSQDIEADAAVFRDSTGRLRAVVESGKLSALTSDPAYLDKLSAVLGVRPVSYTHLKRRESRGRRPERPRNVQAASGALRSAR